MNGGKSLLFFGAGRFSSICFETMMEDARQILGNVAVVVPPGTTELASSAAQMNIEVKTAPLRSLKGWLPDDGPWDFGAVASFSYFLPAQLIDSFRSGIINAHPSLLPKYRGPAPIQRSMIDGYEKGISIIGLDKKEFDAGRIYLSEHTELGDRSDEMDYRKMEERLAVHCGTALSKVFKNWDYYSGISVEQSGEVTFAPKITKADALISFKNQESSSVHRRYLANGHQENLRATLMPSGKVVHLLGITRPTDTLNGSQLDGKTGIAELHGSQIWILCSDGKWIGVNKFRVEGKSNTFSAKDFYKNFIMRHPIQYFE